MPYYNQRAVFASPPSAFSLSFIMPIQRNAYKYKQQDVKDRNENDQITVIISFNNFRFIDVSSVDRFNLFH